MEIWTTKILLKFSKVKTSQKLIITQYFKVLSVKTYRLLDFLKNEMNMPMQDLGIVKTRFSPVYWNLHNKTGYNKFKKHASRSNSRSIAELIFGIISICFSSPDPRTKISFFDRILSIVCRRCCWCRCRNLLTFVSSPEPQEQFQPNLAQSLFE